MDNIVIKIRVSRDGRKIPNGLYSVSHLLTGTEEMADDPSWRGI